MSAAKLKALDAILKITSSVSQSKEADMEAFAARVLKKKKKKTDEEEEE